MAMDLSVPISDAVAESRDLIATGKSLNDQLRKSVKEQRELLGSYRALASEWQVFNHNAYGKYRPASHV